MCLPVPLQKPKELMSAAERAEASTPWREHAAPDGRKYFYNKDTKESKWTLPDELRVRAHTPRRVMP
jgi:pre-mRNA-processing factor 40